LPGCYDDVESGLVRTAVDTSANVHDVTQAAGLLHGEEENVFGDAGYLFVRFFRILNRS